MPRFELNVARDGRHYCRVQLPDSLTAEEAAARAGMICRMFRAELDGPRYEFRLTVWRERGEELAIPNL